MAVSLYVHTFIFHVPLNREGLAAKLTLEAEVFVVREQMFLQAVVVFHWLLANVAAAPAVDVSRILMDHQQRRADKLLAARGTHAKLLDRVHAVHFVVMVMHVQLGPPEPG